MSPIDSNLNYVPYQRHPDAPSVSFGPATQDVMRYTGASPTADGLIPADPTQPAFAYKIGGPAVGWNPDTQAWDT